VKFLLDEHLARLARVLRMLGVDAELSPAGSPDDLLLARAKTEERMLLSRDRLLIARAGSAGFRVAATLPRPQLEEVLARFDLRHETAPFTRCLQCNALLRDAEPDEAASVEEQAPGIEAFWACSGCKKVYWRGSHYERMRDFTDSVLNPTQH
jgi:uncharacterized protein with PIN domain